MLWLACGAVLITSLGWALVLGLGWPLWTAASFSVAVIAILILFRVARMLRAHRRSAALERELMSQTARRAERAPTEGREQILQLQQQMTEAIRVLQRSQLGGHGGKAALYALPWCLILGAPGTGKTTALRSSGLAFAGAGRPRKVHGVGGTQNCDWWFSENAILLDMAGRFALDASVDPEWLAFLDLLKRARPKRPLDAIVVTVSCADLLALSGDRIDESAALLRARLDELIRRLEMVLPVYVLITKADLIAGFVEFWSDLPSTGRGQIWGATFDPGAENIADVSAAVKTEFDILTQALHARALQRIATERVEERRLFILQFPVELTALRRPLSRFVEALFRHTPYGDNPLLRGFYFTSGDRMGSPVNRVLPSGLGASRPSPEGRRLEKEHDSATSYFVADVFRRVVFQDRQLGVRSRLGVRRHVRRQLILAAVTLLVTLLIVMPAATSYRKNVELIADTTSVVEQAGRSRDPGFREPPDVEALDRLLDRINTLDAKSNAVSVRYWWGPYTAEPLGLALRRLYLERLRASVEATLQEQVTASVRSVSDGAVVNDASFKWGFDALKLYSMLTDPTRLEPSWAAAELARAWAQASQRGALPPTPYARKHMQSYAEQVRADRSWAWTPDANLIAGARGRLDTVNIAQMAYHRLTESADGAAPIRPDQIFLADAARFVSWPRALEVPGLYTARGWKNVRAWLDDSPELQFEPWVLGQTTTSAFQWSTDDLRKLYFERYVDAWVDFLTGLDVRAPTNARQALDELAVLGKTDGPYARLFRVLAENVRLEPPPLTLLEQAKQIVDEAADKAKGDEKAEAAPQRSMTDVERAFSAALRFSSGDAVSPSGTPPAEAPPAPLVQYLGLLSDLTVTLERLERAEVDPSTDFQNALSITAGSAERLLTGLSRTEYTTLGPLLMKPIRGTQVVVKGAEGKQINERWALEVWGAYQRLKTHYPFAPDSSDDVSLADFSEFFKPHTGTLWRFYEETLAARLQSSDTRFTPRPSEMDRGYRQGFLSCLARAQQITMALFPDESGRCRLPLEVKMVPAQPGQPSEEVSMIELSVDGQPLIYRNEKETWRAMQWPGEAGPAGAWLSIKGLERSDPRISPDRPFAETLRKFDGDFAFFRLLAFGRMQRVTPGSDTFGASWKVEGRDMRVQMSFRSKLGSRQPFGRGFFSEFECPASVMGGGGQ